MPRIVNSSQQVTTGVQYPHGIYSRVVGFTFMCEAGFARTMFDFTGVLAQQLWLKNVKFRFVFADNVALESLCWRIVTCLTPPSDIDQIMDVLDPVVDIRTKPNTYAVDVGHEVMYSWDMNRLYTGSGRRFAVGVQNNSLEYLWVTASFEISEG